MSISSISNQSLWSYLNLLNSKTAANSDFSGLTAGSCGLNNLQSTNQIDLNTIAEMMMGNGSNIPPIGKAEHQPPADDSMDTLLTKLKEALQQEASTSTDVEQVSFDETLADLISQVQQEHEESLGNVSGSETNPAALDDLLNQLREALEQRLSIGSTTNSAETSEDSAASLISELMHRLSGPPPMPGPNPPSSDSSNSSSSDTSQESQKAMLQALLEQTIDLYLQGYDQDSDTTFQNITV